jgi:peptidoglycan/LPS O-acetylase OafA/YrhL
MRCDHIPGLKVLIGYVGRMRRLVLSTTLDVCCVLAFVAIGRHTHGDGDSLAGTWHTAWPFLVGLLTGLVAARSWRRPASIAPTGIAAWLGAAGAGMAIRVLAGQGTAAAFIAVTFAFLGLFLLGWRGLAYVSGHFRHTNIAS